MRSRWPGQVMRSCSRAGLIAWSPAWVEITSVDLMGLEQIFLDIGFGTEGDIEQAQAEHGGLGLFRRALIVTQF